MQFEPDEAEGDARDEDVDDLPEGVPGDPSHHVVRVGGVLGEEERGGQDGEDTGAVQLFGDHVADERHQEGQTDLERRVAEQRHQLVGEPAERHSHDHRDHRGEHQRPGRLRPRETSADHRADGHVVEHDRGDVVEQPLALQDGDEPPGQSEGAGDGGSGDRVGRCDERAEDERGGDRQPGDDGAATLATVAMVTRTSATASSRIGRTLAVNCRQEVRCTAA